MRLCKEPHRVLEHVSTKRFGEPAETAPRLQLNRVMGLLHVAPVK